METIIFAVIVGLGLAFFATQNTQGVTLHFTQYVWRNIPLYFIAVGSLLLGLILAWIFSLLGSFSSMLSLHNKDAKLKDANKTISELTKEIHKLELELARGDKDKNVDADDDKAL